MPKRKQYCDIDSESNTDNSGTGDQFQVKRKCPNIDDDILHQSHPPIPRSPSSLVQKETRRQERPIKLCFLTDVTSEAKYMANFKQWKEELTRRLYSFYNHTVIENRLPSNMKITWNKRLTKTSGRTGFREDDGLRFAIIELSDKVCDSAERLRDTLIHEMCHAACWILDGEADDLHGWLWQSYCEDAELIHPDLPPITQHHSYTINYSVVYECSGCKNRLGRWTESLNIKKFVCGICHNKMALLNNI